MLLTISLVYIAIHNRNVLGVVVQHTAQSDVSSPSTTADSTCSYFHYGRMHFPIQARWPSCTVHFFTCHCHDYSADSSCLIDLSINTRLMTAPLAWKPVSTYIASLSNVGKASLSWYKSLVRPLVDRSKHDHLNCMGYYHRSLPVAFFGS